MRSFFKILLCVGILTLWGCDSQTGQRRAAYELDQGSPLNREMEGFIGPVKEATTTIIEGKGRKEKTVSVETYGYDSNGRRTKFVYNYPQDQIADSISLSYDSNGVMIFDEADKAEKTFDDNGRLSKVVTVVKDADGNYYGTNVSRFEYDEAGRMLSWVDMDGAVDSLGGCPNLNLAYEYDADGRLAKSYNYGFDGETTEVTFGPNGVERVEIASEADNSNTTLRYEYTEVDSMGNWLAANIYEKRSGYKEKMKRALRTITYYNVNNPVVVPAAIDYRVERAGTITPFTSEWFDDVKARYNYYSYETSSHSNFLIITVLALTLLAFILYIFWLASVRESGEKLFENFTGERQANGMKRLWMYNYQPYLKISIISLMILTAFVTAMLVLFLVGGVTWALMGLLWLVLMALIFVGYACAILGGLALLGKEGAGCLPLIIGVIIIVWQDEIDSFATSLLEWGQQTFADLNVFGWGYSTVATFWDVILIVFLAPIVLFLAFALFVILLDLLLMGIEWVITRIYSVRRPCPSCGSTHTPEYIIGGRPHPVGLFPGLYGTFTHTSPTTGEKVPTMLLNGRGKLKRRCRDCGQYIDNSEATRSFGTEMHVGLVGPRSSGKSYLLYSALQQLIADNGDRIEQIDKDPETDITEKARRINSRGGIQTRVSNRYRGVQLIVHSKLRPVPYHLFFYDVAGEKFNAASQAARTAMEFYRNVQSIVFIIDPTMIDFNRLPASDRFLKWEKANCSGNEKNDIESTFEMMCRILEEQGRSTGKIDITFAVVKTDSGYFRAMGLPESGNTPEMVEAFMVNDLGLRNLINGARAKFKNVSFGSAAVYGDGREDMRSLFRGVLRRLGLSL